MDTIITIILSSISIFAAIVAAHYAREALLASKSPRIEVEAPFNDSLHIRNIGTDTAKNIRETTGMFRDVPAELWNFNGPIDYLRVKSPGTSRMINFHDEKRIKPSSSTVVRFEYENSDGGKFYSEVKIERSTPIQQIYFNSPVLISWGKN